MVLTVPDWLGRVGLHVVVLRMNGLEPGPLQEDDTGSLPKISPKWTVAARSLSVATTRCNQHGGSI